MNKDIGLRVGDKYAAQWLNDIGLTENNGIWCLRTRSLLADRAALVGRVDELEAIEADFKAELVNKAHDFADLERRFDNMKASAEIRVNEHRDTIVALKRTVADSEKRCNIAWSACDAECVERERITKVMQDEIDRLHASVARADGLIKKKDGDIAELTDSDARLRNQLATAKLEASNLEKRSDVLVGRVETLTRENEGLNNLAIVLQDDLTAANSRRSALDERVKELEKSLASVNYQRKLRLDWHETRGKELVARSDTFEQQRNEFREDARLARLDRNAMREQLLELKRTINGASGGFFHEYPNAGGDAPSAVSERFMRRAAEIRNRNNYLGAAALETVAKHAPDLVTSYLADLLDVFDGMTHSLGGTYGAAPSLVQSNFAERTRRFNNAQSAIVTAHEAIGGYQPR